jgi:molybdenum cofactor synthesis domain-containing protein
MSYRKEEIMNLPERFRVLVVTLSDRAYRGEYADLSGPAIIKRLPDFFEAAGWHYEAEIRLLPDDAYLLRQLLEEAAESYNIIFTTGGTGIGPRDITVDTVSPLLKKEIPGIMDYIRTKYGAEIPSALLSRGVAGLIGSALIFTLPGSVKAVDEYMDEILRVLRHTVFMQYGIDMHGKH